MSGEFPPPLGSVFTDPDRHLLLIVAPDASDASVRTAIGIAESRARAVGRTIFADAAFGTGRVHQILGVPNLEGVADIFEFGASLSRVATRPTGQSFEFVPSGPYVPDPQAILRSDRWDRIAEDAAAESAAVLVFVTASASGLDALSRRAGQAIVVGDSATAERAAAALDPECEVSAVVAPMAPPPDSPDDGGAQDVDVSLLDQPELADPIIFRGDEKRPRKNALVWVIAVIVLAVAGWSAYRTFLTPAPPPPEPVTAEESAPAAPPPAPEPVETPVGFSVAVEAHQDLPTARERLEILEESDPAVTYYISPVPIGGSVWYRVLAGPVADREAGAALMRRLVDAGHKTAFDDWAVRPTTHAFLLGDFETEEAADRRVIGLRELGVPAYIVPIDYEPGPLHYRVYGGAFENPGSAEIMGEMLADVRIRAPLVERVGVPLEVTR